MTVSNTALSAAPATPADAPSGVLAFRGLWLFSSRADAVFLGLPLLLTLVAATVSLVAAGGTADQSHRLAMWTAQNLLGSGTHVILSFLLMAVHRDVLTADPKQPRALLAGSGAALVGTAAGFFFLYYADRLAYAYTAAILFGVFGMHHMLAQHKGFWSLHGLRASQAGLPAISARERQLMQVYVPLMVTLTLTRLLFIPDSAEAGATPYLDVGQGALLPHGTLALLITVWLGYFVLLFRTVLRTGQLSGPKLMYLGAVAIVTGLLLVAPPWGNVMLLAMHGLEYFMITARMLEPRPGDAPSRFGRAWIWPLMVLSMLPLLALGVMDGFILGTVYGEKAPASLAMNPVLRASITLGLGVVLAHYVADAFIYRFRIPGIRKVMLRRLGFGAPASPAPVPVSTPR
jgi:hypothetical protein